MVAEYERELVSFFNMAVLGEMASGLASVEGKVFKVPATISRTLAALARSEFPDDLAPPLPEANRLADVSRMANLVLARIRQGIALGMPTGAAGTIDFVARLVEAVKRDMPELAARRFLFLLDDYTDERVPIPLQRSLHPIVSQRSPDFCFKLSAHMFGSIYCYPHNLALDEGRNVLVVNIGHEYLNPKRKKVERDCLVQILNARIRNSPTHDGTIEDWLGETGFPGGVSLARALHDEKTRQRAYYHGIDCLVDLCSGDIAEMVRMVRAIFQRAGVADPSPDERRRTPSRIPPQTQSDAITAVSRELLNRVRHIPRDGQKLFDILNAFGNLSRRYLWYHPLVGQGKTARGKERKDPYGLLTVYVDDLTRAQHWARQRWQHLQRAAIFIDIRAGRSQRQTIADRATLRRVFCPAFRTCLSSSEPLQLTKKMFELLMDKPDEFCKKRGPGKAKQVGELRLLEEPVDRPEEQVAYPTVGTLPRSRDRCKFSELVAPSTDSFSRKLPPVVPIESVTAPSAQFDVFIGAIGFEDRTTGAIKALVDLGVQARIVLLLEFDVYHEANEEHRKEYEELAQRLSRGAPHRPVNAPVATPDAEFMARLGSRLKAAVGADRPKVLFDCTSCPSLLLSQTLQILLSLPCDLTLLYSEAAEYFPSRDEWESGQIKPPGDLVRGPCYGFNFTSKPTGLQADDVGEKPVALAAFPTFNTARTDGVLAELAPAERIWVFGEPHEIDRNKYRYEMMVAMAAPLMHPGDPWTVVTTFDYRAAFLELAGIYGQFRPTHRLLVLPHGSKMQTVGVGLFCLAHPVSLVFANPQTYNPKRYSRGCLAQWCIQFGDTEDLRTRLLKARVTGGTNRAAG